MKQRKNSKTIFSSIRGSENWLNVLPVNSGDSTDQKYFISDSHNQEYFLKISSMAHYDRRKQEFEHLENLYKNYACVPRPLDFGVCLNKQQSYTLSQRANGETVARLLQMDAGGRFGKGNPEHDKYLLGVDFGVMMQQIHTPLTAWYQSANGGWLESAADQVLQATVSQLTSQAAVMNLSDLLGIDLAAFINERVMHLPSCLPCLLHGDIKMEHAIMTPLHGLLMTDFADWSYGHPYSELANILIDFRAVNKNFLTGVLDGYLTHKQSSRQLFSLSFYVALSLVQRLVTAADPAGEQSMQIARRIVSDFDGFRSTIPRWYHLHA